MPAAVLAIIIVSIVMGTITSVVKMSLAYHERKAALRAGSLDESLSKASRKATKQGGSTVTTSELEDMMQRVVDKATQPIRDRLEVLESEIGVRPALPEAEPRIDLDEVLDEHLDERESAMAPAKRRSR